MKNLSGRWKLVNEGSDYYPGLDNLTDAPLVLKLLGTIEVEFYRIEKRKTLEIEELHFTYVTKGVSMSRSYQIGVLNYENVVGNNVTLGIIQNCDELFYEFTLTRLGPKQGQTSRETFRLDAGTDRVTLTIELHTPEGSHLKMIKYLIRFDEKEKIDNVPFKHAVNSMGWKLFEFWESSVLSNAQAKIIRAVKIKSQSLQTNTGTKVLETIWNDPEFDHLFQNNEFDWSSIAKSHGNKNSEAEEVVEFIVKVKINESNWFVAHRYREFDALRKFILSQNPYNTEFQQADVKFPGKIMGMFRKAAMDKRVEGLEGFTSFYLENARFCRQNSIDALCSFLQIPENMHRIAREKAAAEPPPPPPAPVVTAARPGANKPITTTVNASKPAEPPKQEKPKNILNMFSGNSNTNTAPQKKEPAAPAPAPTASSNTSAPATATNNTTTSTTSASPAKAVVQPPASVTSETQSTLVFDPVLSPAQSRLLKRLNQGLQVIKHGRQGNPHPRALQCDDEVQNLIVQGPDRYKKIPIDSIDGLRLGSEIDPITSPEAIARYNTEGAEAKAARRKSTIGKLLGGKDEVLFGTAILRRTCKPEDMPLCISLLMEDRTLDLQCANQEDLNFLYTNLKEIIKK